jgi:GH15 family glucan-1,4-alpha-glucosidase
VAVDLNLGVIGNCQVAGLIDVMGRLVWACLPRMDGDPVFCALLDAKGGNAESGLFAVDVVDAAASSQSYLRNTAVIRTLIRDSAGHEIAITDFCPRFRRRGRTFHPVMFVRIVEPVAGHARIRFRLRPAGDYGREPATPSFGSHHLRFQAGHIHYRVTTDASLTAVLEQRHLTLDRPYAFLLGPDETVEQSPLMLARALLLDTEDYWRDWVRSLAVPLDWQEAVIRAAITLKLCSFEDTGAVLAALTTSIPEAADSGRNWDYRYCWLRDSYFVVQALNRLGATRTMEGYLHYIRNIVAQSPHGQLQPVYSIAGDADLDESEVTSLAGYRGMGPVRVGNLAYKQRQNDVYGAIVLAASQRYFDARLSVPGDEALFRELEQLGEQAVARSTQPDAGPWELRGSESRHTFSSVMCWAACDRLANIAAVQGLSERAGYWRKHAEAISGDALEHSWNATVGSFVGQFGGSDVDATALLMPALKFVPAGDPRFVATLAAIDRDLRTGDLLLRYRHPDDFGVPVNAFAPCSFWYVNALAAAGRDSQARELFDRLLARRNPLGLMSEHIDPHSGEHWGNYPQTYCMVGIIFAALRLSRAWEEVL